MPARGGPLIVTVYYAESSAPPEDRSAMLDEIARIVSSLRDG